VDSAGTTLTINWNFQAAQGTGYSGDLTLDINNGGSTYSLTLVSGSGTKTWVMSIGTTVNQGDTVALDFAGSADAIEDSVGTDLGAFSGQSVTNNSTQSSGRVVTDSASGGRLEQDTALLGGASAAWAIFGYNELTALEGFSTRFFREIDGNTTGGLTVKTDGNDDFTIVFQDSSNSYKVDTTSLTTNTRFFWFLNHDGAGNWNFGWAPVGGTFKTDTVSDGTYIQPVDAQFGEAPDVTGWSAGYGVMNRQLTDNEENYLFQWLNDNNVPPTYSELQNATSNDANGVSGDQISADLVHYFNMDEQSDGSASVARADSVGNAVFNDPNQIPSQTIS
jgi:hypothetical protein